MNAQTIPFPVPIEPAELTVGQIISEYLAEKAIQVNRGLYASRSLEKVTHYLRVFEKTYGPIPISRCKRSDLRRWITAHPEWKAPGTMQDACGSIITCFRWAASDGELIDQCPFVRPKNLIAPPRQRPAIKPEEYRSIMNLARACDGKRRRSRPSRGAFRIATFFLWETGARTCEMREALWEWVDWEKGVIVYPDHKTFGSTGVERMVPLTAKLIRLLRRLQRRGGKGHIFLSGRGGPWSRETYGKMFVKYAKIAGIRTGVTAYCLRHGFTVRGLEAEIGDRQLADVLGHSTTRYVSWYGKTARTKADYLRKITEKISAKTK